MTTPTGGAGRPPQGVAVRPLDGILEVDQGAVGAGGQGLVEPIRPVARHEQGASWRVQHLAWPVQNERGRPSRCSAT